ncbi:hypothetical protein EVAR_54322_1 [Eumeta japonica]|uniref:Uncharacterized protein n=1 Tax=Eumeta variegata TaxID=151549 RepID=A0A4C1Y8C6_EUMVA|nr:hypothetical protein EVAR_54322_1 [Eumeta japonica]
MRSRSKSTARLTAIIIESDNGTGTDLNRVRGIACRSSPARVPVSICPFSSIVMVARPPRDYAARRRRYKNAQNVINSERSRAPDKGRHRRGRAARSQSPPAYIILVNNNFIKM